VKKARTVLRGKVNPERRTAMVKIPRSVRAFEKASGKLKD